jgi:regulatory protein
MSSRRSDKPSRNGQPLSAWERTVKILAGRRHAAAELRRKLAARGHEAGEVEGALARARELGYLDDEGAARDWARELAHRGGQGRRRARKKLIARGLDPALVQRALDEVWDDELERAHLEEVLDRLLARDPEALATREGRARLHRKLLSRGFSRGVSAELLARRAEGGR